MAFNYPAYGGYGPQPMQQLTPQQIQFQQQQLQQQIQQLQQPIQQPVQQQMQPQIQNGGLVVIQDPKEIDPYPVALGTSVTFFCPSVMKMFTKTKDFSPIKEPVVESYTVTKDGQIKSEKTEEKTESEEKETPNIQYAAKEEIEALSARIDALKKKVTSTLERVDLLSERIDALSVKKQPTRSKKEEDDDE